MRRMAVAFNTTVSDLEDELTQLILDGQISARIDSHSKVRQLVLPYCSGQAHVIVKRCFIGETLIRGRDFIRLWYGPLW